VKRAKAVTGKIRQNSAASVFQCDLSTMFALLVLDAVDVVVNFFLSKTSFRL